jgi:23S rRNA (uracil1939-C5)-methyltransferase
LAATVKRMVDECEPTPGGVFLDAYSGVGLFGALVAGDRPVVAVESSKWSVADARVNLGPGAKVIKASLERWRPEAATVVVADPARAGLGKQAAGRLAATGCQALVLVSCDPASLARDAKILDGHGYELVEVALVDIFGQTSHIEAVSRFQPRR